MHPASRAFATVADRYERGRPGYPAPAVRTMVEELGMREGRVLELGAGTGKLTRSLVERGVEVVATEPLGEMCGALRGVLPSTPAALALAEALPFQGAAFGGVVAAQALHWFDLPVALAEIARVLRPGGGLGLIWNRRAFRLDAVDAIFDRHAADAPREKSRDWEADVRAAGVFAPFEVHEFENVHHVDPEIMVDRVLTTSFIAALPADTRAGIEEEVRAATAHLPRDEAGRIPMRYETALYLTRRS